MRNIKILAIILLVFTVLFTGCKLERSNPLDPESASYIADTVIPLVESFSIASGSAGVELNVSMTAVFSEAMDTAAVESAFSLAAGSSVSGSFEWTDDEKSVTFTPSSNLALYENYTATISSAATDIRGNKIAALTNTFTTRGPVGVLDTDFDTDGSYTFKDPDNYSAKTEGRAAIIDSAGRILITGKHDEDMCIWRYNADGSLDTSFNGKGWVTHSNAAGGDGEDIGLGIAEDSNGRIFVTGFSKNNEGYYFDMVLWCFTSDGILDEYNFGSPSGSGYAVYDGGTYINAKGYALTIDDDDSIYVTGIADSDMILWCCDYWGASSTPEIYSYPAVSGDACGTAIELDSQGRLVIAGYNENGSLSDIAIWRCSTAGVLDNTFSSDGYQSSSGVVGGAKEDHAFDLCLDSDGNIFITGSVDEFCDLGEYDYTDDAMVLLKIKEDGTFDADFGDGGYITNRIFETEGELTRGTGIAVDAAGKILISGAHGSSAVTEYSDCMFALWRYNADGSLDTGFNEQGWNDSDETVCLTYSSFTPEILIDENSKINIIGFKRNSAGYHDMTIWRYE